MNNDKQKLRSDIPESDRWNIKAMYPDESLLDDDISNGLARADSLASMKDHVMDSPSSLLNALILFSESVRSVERAYIYAHMKRDEDNSDPHNTALFGKAAAALTTLTSAVSAIRD